MSARVIHFEVATPIPAPTPTSQEKTMINVTQNADGSIQLTGATSITVKQVIGGMQLTANDALSLPLDTGPALMAKIVKARTDLAATQADVTKVIADLV